MDFKYIAKHQKEKAKSKYIARGHNEWPLIKAEELWRARNQDRRNATFSLGLSLWKRRHVLFRTMFFRDLTRQYDSLNLWRENLNWFLNVLTVKSYTGWGGFLYDPFALPVQLAIPKSKSSTKKARQELSEAAIDTFQIIPSSLWYSRQNRRGARKTFSISAIRKAEDYLQQGTWPTLLILNVA